MDSQGHKDQERLRSCPRTEEAQETGRFSVPDAVLGQRRDIRQNGGDVNEVCSCGDSSAPMLAAILRNVPHKCKMSALRESRKRGVQELSIIFNTFLKIWKVFQNTKYTEKNTPRHPIKKTAKKKKNSQLKRTQS